MAEETTGRNLIGSVLQTYRMKAGYTQKQIGFMTNKAPQTIASWESGKSQPDIQTFIAICYIYGIIDIFKTFENDKFIINENLALNEGKKDYDYHTPGLTDNERNLLVKYRKLDDKSQKLVDDILSSFVNNLDEKTEE